VPPPTEPSSIGPDAASSIARCASSSVMRRSLIAWRNPSHVSAATGSAHSSFGSGWRVCSQLLIAACAMPTAAVLVIAIGSATVPDSSIHTHPVISPLPLSEYAPAAHASCGCALPRGWMAVTPVRTSSPSISVVYPTSTPATSVIAFHGPGVPSNGMPYARARGLPDGVARCGSLMRGSLHAH
jgi:hypothetical protein